MIGLGLGGAGLGAAVRRATGCAGDYERLRSISIAPWAFGPGKAKTEAK